MLDSAAEVFTSVRPRLFGIAYRMLGSAAEAEDLVQEVWLRWQATTARVVEHPAAFLATTTTRLAINALQSARARRETYIGPWLPEPVDTAADPYLGAERGEALELAALLLMEKLTPNERAAYVLRVAFDYPYPQIAEILQSSEPAVRQLVSRARKHMADGRRKPVRPDGAAHAAGDIPRRGASRATWRGLERLFAADVTSVSDGNGAHQVSRRRWWARRGSRSSSRPSRPGSGRPSRSSGRRERPDRRGAAPRTASCTAWSRSSPRKRASTRCCGW